MALKIILNTIKICKNFINFNNIIKFLHIHTILNLWVNIFQWFYKMLFMLSSVDKNTNICINKNIQ